MIPLVLMPVVCERRHTRDYKESSKVTFSDFFHVRMRTARRRRVTATGGLNVTTESTAGRNARMYNDPLFNYAQFWTGRDYEHQAELVALRRLLAGRRYRHAADIGGGFGRLAVVLPNTRTGSP